MKRSLLIILAAIFLAGLTACGEKTSSLTPEERRDAEWTRAQRQPKPEPTKVTCPRCKGTGSQYQYVEDHRMALANGTCTYCRGEGLITAGNKRQP